ncbi:Serine/threonine-protein phosphatase 7 long form [Glycine max]|nr:Serine/threonine-protein phosphatase 7 long form [Glycine max]
MVPLICFHVEWHQPDRVLRQFGLQQPISGCSSQPQNLHGITLKGKQDENWFQLLAPIISQCKNRAEFRVDVYPQQEGLLSFNSDYMVWYRRKTNMFVDPNNANTTTLVITLILLRANIRSVVLWKHNLIFHDPL